MEDFGEFRKFTNIFSIITDIRLKENETVHRIFLRIKEVQRNSLDIIPEKVPVEQPVKLEGGGDSALKGKLNSDKRIQRVSDIYDLMEEK